MINSMNYIVSQLVRANGGLAAQPVSSPLSIKGQ